MAEHEQERLDRIAGDNNYDRGINKRIIEYTADIFKRFMKDGSVLEMGPAHGLATDLLYPSFPKYSVVDASELFINMIHERHPKVETYVSLFEDFNPKKKFDNILIGHVLEHVEDPVAILRRCREWKTDSGIVLAAVPNSGSLHRLAGVKLGLIKDVSELNESDLKVGHRRVYNLDSFIADFHKAGFHVTKSGGYWLKVIPNAQIEKTWSEEQIQVCMELGEEFPNIASNIYVVAE